MMSEHTKEPWKIVETLGGVGISSGGEVFAEIYDDSYHGEQRDANARRIVACVNACQGIETEELERNGAMEELPRCDTCDRPYLDDDELSEQRGAGPDWVNVCPVCTTEERVKALEARLAKAREALVAIQSWATEGMDGDAVLALARCAIIERTARRAWLENEE